MLGDQPHNSNFDTAILIASGALVGEYNLKCLTICFLVNKQDHLWIILNIRLTPPQKTTTIYAAQ